MAEYREIFSEECQFRHFGKYLTDFIIAKHKTVLGINGKFIVKTD
jgi:hypothetical protein